MQTIKQPYNRLLFIIGCLFVLLFWFWSSAIVFSILLLIVIESCTIGVIASFIKKKIPSIFYKIIRYAYGIFVFTFIITVLRTFVTDVYYVPSSSMEKTLFPNDYVLVNKISYGVKLPNYFGDIPVIGSIFNPRYVPKQFQRFTPLKAFKNFERNDIVVFNTPEKNRKLLFIKRLIGLPGDTLSIKNTTVIINGNVISESKDISYRYEDDNGLFAMYSNAELDTLSAPQKSVLKKVIYGDVLKSEMIFPKSKKDSWTIDNYGEIVIPRKGMTIPLTAENIVLYGTCIRDFEGNKNLLSDQSKSTYTFTQNYYFVLGDNRHNSIDSRMYGFVPENFIQGKMVTVLF